MRLLAFALLAVHASTQGFAGFTNLTLQNPTGQGSPSIPATVYYPANAPGHQSPLLPQPGGHPVLVFLHGLNVLGSGYGALGERFAQRGYVVVLGNTAQSSATQQLADGIATFAALGLANTQPGHFLQGALDMTRAGVAGHSMGGSTTIGCLAANPGYRAGFCFSPGITPAASQVQVPLGICHGTGDQFLDWQTFGQSLYQNLTAVQDLKFFYVLNQDCTHGNVAGYSQATQLDRDVFDASSRVAIGFFDRYLRGEAKALEDAIGPSARAEPRLFQLDLEVRTPELWLFGTPSIGQQVSFRIAAQPGPTWLLWAAAESNWPSPFGTVLLDPATLSVFTSGTIGADHLWTLPLVLPNDPGLVGLQFPFQGLGFDHLGNGELTGLLRLAIGS